MLLPKISPVALLLAGSLLGLPALAHKTEVSGDVAGTWHLEPNHSPKADEPAQVWVALTQRGGEAIPLAQCDCQLKIYATSAAEATPVLEPQLEALSPENHRQIPGATVTFPEVGEYRLELSGRPQAGGSFAPFELSYTTVVAAGQHSSGHDSTASPTARVPAALEANPVEPPRWDNPSDAAAATPDPMRSPVLNWLILALGGGAGAIALMVFLRRRRQTIAKSK